MGYHSIAYYNNKMKKGNTDKTGYAWWYDASKENPDNPSHFPGFIPFPVVRTFFGWDAEESTRLVAIFEIPLLDEDGLPVIGEDGNPVINTYEEPVTDYNALGRSDWIVGGIPESEEADASKILSVVGKDYGVHQAKEIFIENLLKLAGDNVDNIGVESLGELKNGKRLFGSVSLAEHLLNKESGLEFRPILTIVTSFDQTLATKYVRTFGVPICDNTLNWELTKAGEKDGQFVIRHTRNSAARLGDAKAVLGLLTESADEFNTFVDGLVQAPVTEKQFIAWLDVMVPVPEVKETIVTAKSIQGEDVQMKKVSTNAQTIALKKRDKLVEMWDTDPRVSQWKGNRLGILQLWNTYNQHEASFKGTKAAGGDKNAARAENNLNKSIEGKFTDEDMRALKAITEITADDELVSVGVSGVELKDSTPPEKVPAKRAPRKATGN